MRWLPRFQIFGTMICADDGEIEGWTFHACWFGLVLEITVARETIHG